MTIQVPFEAQLPELYGGTLCSAVSTARGIYWATQGKTSVTGAQVRARTDEPVPDPKSPGLNLPQVAAAARHWSVYLDVRIGSAAVTIAEYERRRKAGQGCIAQLGYGPIADSKYDAGNGFRGGHAIFENNVSTFDSLADGRYANVWEYDRRLYERSLIQSGASKLVIQVVNGRPIYAKAGTIWAAFTLDVIPEYHVQMPPGRGFYRYMVDSTGVITGRHATSTTNGFGADCEPPVYHSWPNGPVALKRLVKLTEGSREGWFVEARFATETP